MAGSHRRGNTLGRASLTVECILVSIAVLLFAAVVLLLPSGALRALVGIAGLLLLPGYAFTTLLFPAQKRQPTTEPMAIEHRSDRAALSDVERLAVSFGFSVALVPLFGFVLSVTGGGINVNSIVFVVSGFTILTLFASAVRRVRVPEKHRYVLPLDRLGAVVEHGLSRRRGDVVLNVLLTLAILSATVGFAYAAVSPLDGSSFTEAALLTEDEEGELVAADYDTTLTAGQSTDYVLAVENHEGETAHYTVVVQLQRVENDQVLLSKELTRLQNTVRNNETWLARHSISSQLLGENLRLTYLIYRGEAPANPRMESAYRSLTLWVSVSPSGQADVETERLPPAEQPRAADP